MTLEQQLTSLELSKRLKELGVEQESLFAWHEVPFEEGDWFLKARDVWTGGVSAFTVAELGEMLPTLVESWQRSDDWACRTNYTKGDEQPLLTYMFTAETEADARAKTLIYLLENGLLKN